MIEGEEEVVQGLKASKIIPVVAIENAEDAIALCGALQAGGLNAIEITFRTEAAAGALAAVAETYPDILLGAGTVTRVEELERAHQAGAHFAVAPGFNPVTLAQAEVMRMPFFPGVCTPSDIESALQYGLKFLKFFPAEAAGGLKMLSALYGPYAHRGIEFMPTGGINIGNVQSYLRHPGVAAVGGTWIVPTSAIAHKDWTAIENLTREAVTIVESIT